MRTSEKIDLICAALAAAQGEMEDAKMTAVNPYFKSKYATLKDMRDASRPTLAKHKLCITQGVSAEGEEVHVTTILGHESGQFFETVLALHPEKLTPQSMGSAITYGRRYSWSGILGMATETDDDGNAGEGMGLKGVQKKASPKAESHKKTLEDMTVGELKKKAEAGIQALYERNKKDPDIGEDEEAEAQRRYLEEIWDKKDLLIIFIKSMATKLNEPVQGEL